MNEAINAHDLGIAGGYIIEQTLGERIAGLERENAELRESLQDFYDVACAFYRGVGTEDDLRDLSRQLRELGVGEWASSTLPSTDGS